MTIRTVKRMRRVQPEFKGKCSYCTSEYEGSEGDVKVINGGRNDVYYSSTDCNVCNKNMTVQWIKVKDITYEAVPSQGGYFER